VPFVPFTIRMASGHEYPVPTEDHIWLPPGAARVVVSDDEGCTSLLPALFISGLVKSVPPELSPTESPR
ncbi:MAG TPA: hypothetical protein VGO90_11145, partial [Chthoniobacteraceae bacterium]|nr:hypothetical protein [Chthoniobacteraceae bacterium]